ncbi:tyrosine-protein kinase transmembrane receptor ROR1-like protein [Dinothrombium tinctorium]|uniref:Tyrosine-protein kinase transmembrane receptor ROR1-like protein n=1 Tax=Dinothrombium tinctorium TaxID=1965070 RepID=A0A3S3PP78_9ACAR|nr:tyrosine-protein kinase transmembrane receptor ROR1-like protein [Dinothrombium tinctorium]
MTKESGQNVRMKCEFKGNPTPVEIKWYKNEAPLEIEKGKIEIKHSSSGKGRIQSKLRILRLDTHDMGYYKCEAANSYKTVETIGILKVIRGQYMSSAAALPLPDYQPMIPEFPGLGHGRNRVSDSTHN